MEIDIFVAQAGGGRTTMKSATTNNGELSSLTMLYVPETSILDELYLHTTQSTDNYEENFLE